MPSGSLVNANTNQALAKIFPDQQYVESVKAVEVTLPSRIRCFRPTVSLSIDGKQMKKTFPVGFGSNSFIWKFKEPQLVPTGSSLEATWRALSFGKKIVKISLSYDEIKAALGEDTGVYHQSICGTSINILLQRHYGGLADDQRHPPRVHDYRQPTDWSFSESSPGPTTLVGSTPSSSPQQHPRPTSLIATPIPGESYRHSFADACYPEGRAFPSPIHTEITLHGDTPGHEPIQVPLVHQPGVPRTTLKRPIPWKSPVGIDNMVPSSSQSLDTSSMGGPSRPARRVTFVDQSINNGGVFNKIGGNQYNYHVADPDKYLNELNPNYTLNNPRRCLDGTREDIISQIIEWANNDDITNILWLHAYPGAGKSTVASTVAHRLSESGRLGAIFAFSANSGSQASILWRLVSYKLAQRFAVCRNAVVEKLQFRETWLANATAKEIFTELVEEPLQKLAECSPRAESLPVFVIDGLDEYSSWEEPHHRLFACIKLWPRLPIPLKLVITSRLEDRIQKLFIDVPHFPLVIGTGDNASPQSINDIRTFFEVEFRRVSEEFQLPDTWPGEDILDRFVTSAGGIFIWAATISRYIAENPGRLTDDQSTALSSGGLYSLYNQILQKSFDNWGSNECIDFQKFVTVVSLAQLELTEPDIGSVLGATVGSVISKRLRPVLKGGPVVQFAHQSFVDFLEGRDEDTSSGRPLSSGCPTQFRVNRDKLLPLLHQFASLFATRFNESQKLSDLDNVIASQRQMLDLMAYDDPNTPHIAVLLGCSLSSRFSLLENIPDIEESIILLLTSNEMTPDDDSEKSGRLHHLAVASTLRFKRLGEIKDIDDAIAAFQLSIGFHDGDEDDASLRSTLAFLSDALRLRFHCTHDAKDINDAISLLQRLTQLDTGSEQSEYLAVLQRALGEQLANRGRCTHVKQAIASQGNAIEQSDPSY